MLWVFYSMGSIETEAVVEHRVAAMFGVLKQRLLLQRLNETSEPELHVLIIRQANESAFLAWLTAYPALAFPCLFEERSRAALERARGDALHYWRGFGSGGAGNGGRTDSMIVMPVQGQFEVQKQEVALQVAQFGSTHPANLERLS